MNLLDIMEGPSLWDGPSIEIRGPFTIADCDRLLDAAKGATGRDGRTEEAPVQGGRLVPCKASREGWVGFRFEPDPETKKEPPRSEDHGGI